MTAEKQSTTGSSATWKDPVDRAKRNFDREANKVGESERHSEGIGDESTSWYQRDEGNAWQSGSGRVLFRDSNLVVTVIVSGMDQSGDNQDVPMPAEQARSQALKLALSIAADL